MTICLESRKLKVSFCIFQAIENWEGLLTSILGPGALKRTSMTTAEDSSKIEPKKIKLGNLEVKNEEEESMVKMDSKKPRDINKDIKNTLKTFTREVCSKFFTRLGNMRFL